MNTGILTKYSASAGSGKTTELTRRFVTKLFISPYYYRKILAVTFTNKAAAEMKGRILKQLWQIASDEKNSEIERLSSATGKSMEQIVSDAGKILVNILHDYSRFSVGTIDSFFQRVLKAFSRESGLQSGYQIELDHSMILSEAVDSMLSDLEKDKELLSWVTEFASARVEEGKSWNIKKEILELSEELFREQFKLLPLNEKEKLSDRKLMTEYVSRVKHIRTDFSSHLHPRAGKIRILLDRYLVTDEMFFQGKKGLPAFIKKISEKKIDTSELLNSYIIKVLENPPTWYTRPSPELIAALENGLDQEIISAVRYFNENQIIVNTADAILSNIYTLGILSDVLKNIHEITTAENRFLLSDTGELLYLIIGNDQTPFIYEKIGNYFENYMIDEFQDTSAIQWMDFKPLINNSMAEGLDNLVVGDVKQSIYRWRNSNWKIFSEIIDKEIGEKRLKIEKLDKNYRSRINLISFNNSLFSIIPAILDQRFVNKNHKLSDLYIDAKQASGSKKEGGFVNIEIISETEDGAFTDIVLGKLPGIISDLQKKGFKGSDIGILVRRNSEGSAILKYMLDFRSHLPAGEESDNCFEFISNESLILDQNPGIRFILSFLRWIYNPDDDISKSLTIRNYLLSTGKNPVEADLCITDLNDSNFNELFPAGFENIGFEIRHLSLFEAVEKIIDFFNLGKYTGNAAYLNAFQDCVMEFMKSDSSEITSFLDWWDGSGKKRSIILSDQENSVRVMTIHKSKGLQFKAVILPFLNWNMTHDRNPTLWLTPHTEPFNALSLVPVKYTKTLELSYFAEDYENEKFSSVVDNLNLLYVALTRAEDCLIGFTETNSGKKSVTIGSVLEEAFQSKTELNSEKPVIRLLDYFDKVRHYIRIGEIQDVSSGKGLIEDVATDNYPVNLSLEKLRLKLHGEDFLIKLSAEQEKKLNYGKLMHEVFSLITAPDDISPAVIRLNLEGKIPDNETEKLISRMQDLISFPEVAGWFAKDGNVIVETDILLPAGNTKRPDRIILKGDKTIIVDFKFGEEKYSYKKQVRNYAMLLENMGYRNIEAFLWYVDKNIIEKA